MIIGVGSIWNWFYSSTSWIELNWIFSFGDSQGFKAVLPFSDTCFFKQNAVVVQSSLPDEADVWMCQRQSLAAKVRYSIHEVEYQVTEQQRAA